MSIRYQDKSAQRQEYQDLVEEYMAKRQVTQCRTAKAAGHKGLKDDDDSRYQAAQAKKVKAA